MKKKINLLNKNFWRLDFMVISHSNSDINVTDFISLSDVAILTDNTYSTIYLLI
jgi:hypothetical protein